MLSRKDAAIIGAYTGITCGPFPDIHEYIEKILGRSVFSHELASTVVWEEIKEKSKADFLAICASDKPSKTKGKKS